MTVVSAQFAIKLLYQRQMVQSPESYPFSLSVLKNLDSLDLHPKVTFFIGENGSGKSTLLEAIALTLGLNPEGGSQNFNFHTRPSHSSLHEFLRIAKGFKRPKNKFFLRAESFFNVATEIENLDAEPSFSPPIIGAYGNHSLHEQSHGESFMALLMNRFGAEGLYVLDEPEAALSPQRQLAALRRIHDLVQQNCQFIIATHSPILMAYPDAVIYECTDHGLQRVRYEETDHYTITKNFLLNHQRMLDTLFSD